ncbi:MAG TPA: hypothetical protein VKH45_01120 [Candidatus Acidoferrum sp.]|nr:hypothetical protein [Candidatus Acidoferrum sp.]
MSYRKRDEQFGGEAIQQADSRRQGNLRLPDFPQDSQRSVADNFLASSAR